MNIMFRKAQEKQIDLPRRVHVRKSLWNRIASFYKAKIKLDRGGKILRVASKSKDDLDYLVESCETLIEQLSGNLCDNEHSSMTHLFVACGSKSSWVFKEVSTDKGAYTLEYKTEKQVQEAKHGAENSGVAVEYHKKGNFFQDDTLINRAATLYPWIDGIGKNGRPVIEIGLLTFQDLKEDLKSKDILEWEELRALEDGMDFAVKFDRWFPKTNKIIRRIKNYARCRTEEYCVVKVKNNENKKVSELWFKKSGLTYRFDKTCVSSDHQEASVGFMAKEGLSYRISSVVPVKASEKESLEQRVSMCGNGKFKVNDEKYSVLKREHMTVESIRINENVVMKVIYGPRNKGVVKAQLECEAPASDANQDAITLLQTVSTLID